MEAEVAINTTAEIWWVTKVVVPLIGIAVASVIIPLLLHKLKYKREREERLFEARKEAYREYFQKFESAANDMGNDYDHFSKVVMPEKFMKLLESDSSPEAIAEFSEAVGDFPHKIQNGYRKTTEEITCLQIICSNELLSLTNEFEKKYKMAMDMSSEWLEELNQTFTVPDMDTPKASEMKALGVEIGELKNKIISQMRKEIGSDG
jgi:tRNA A37 N6-isopentenylltransferase MiaA